MVSLKKKMCHIFFIISSSEGYLSCYQILAIIHRTAMNMAEQVSLWQY